MSNAKVPPTASSRKSPVTRTPYRQKVRLEPSLQQPARIFRLHLAAHPGASSSLASASLSAGGGMHPDLRRLSVGNLPKAQQHNQASTWVFGQIKGETGRFEGRQHVFPEAIRPQDTSELGLQNPSLLQSRPRFILNLPSIDDLCELSGCRIRKLEGGIAMGRPIRIKLRGGLHRYPQSPDA